MLNNNQVSAEIINTIAGSFGLASTAPLTALMAGLILPGNTKRQKKKTGTEKFRIQSLKNKYKNL